MASRNNANPGVGDSGARQKVQHSGTNAADKNNQDFPPSQAADAFGTRDAESVTTQIVTADDAAAPMTPLQAQEILNEHADAIRACARRTVHDIIEIGRHLAEAKKMVGHGNFLPWIEREFAWSEDTAERLIAVYALQRQIPHVAELSLPFSGLYLLAAPSTPPEAVEVIVAKAEDGERVNVAEIKATITEAKAKWKPRLPSCKPEQPKTMPSSAPQNANLGRGATAKSKDNLKWFAVACRQYLPDVTVAAHRQEARRLVAELTDGAQ
jgi:hypothetical protein